MTQGHRCHAWEEFGFYSKCQKETTDPIATWKRESHMEAGKLHFLSYIPQCQSSGHGLAHLCLFMQKAGSIGVD